MTPSSVPGNTAGALGGEQGWPLDEHQLAELAELYAVRMTHGEWLCPVCWQLPDTPMHEKGCKLGRFIGGTRG